jgi:molybdopterin converting factor small subunit
MRVTFLLFASYRDLVGTPSGIIELEQGATAGIAVAALRSRGGAWSTLPDRPVVAVNEEYAKLDRRLEDGDELALLPPVAGG